MNNKYLNKLDKKIIILLFLCPMTFASRGVDDIQSGLFSMGNIVRLIVAPLCIFLCLLYFLKFGISLKNMSNNSKCFCFYWIIGGISFVNMSTNWYKYSLLKYAEYAVLIFVIIYICSRIRVNQNVIKGFFIIGVKFYQFLIFTVLLGLILNPQKALFAETEYSELRNAIIPFVLRGHIVTLSATTVGYCSGILLYIYLIDLIENNNKSKKHILKMSIVSVCFLLAQSRTSWIAFCIALIWYIIISGKSASIKFLLINFGICGAIIFKDKLLAMLLRGQSKTNFTSFTGRTRWWEHSIDVFKEANILKKMFGQGFASGEKMVANQVSTVMGTLDSDYFGALTSTGVFGLLFIISCIASSLYQVLIKIPKILSNKLTCIEDYSITLQAGGICLILMIRTFTVTSLGTLNYNLILFIISNMVIHVVYKNINKDSQKILNSQKA